MKKVFWDHLIEIEEISIAIDKQAIGKKEKEKLLRVVYQTFDMHILTTVLSHLPKEKHPKFLDYFSKKPDHPQILSLLTKEVQDIEEKIKIAAQKIKKEILVELHKH